MTNQQSDEHTGITTEILEVIDQQPSNRYAVALRLTRWFDVKAAGITKAYISKAAVVEAIGRDEMPYVMPPIPVSFGDPDVAKSRQNTNAIAMIPILSGRDQVRQEIRQKLGLTENGEEE